MNKITLNDINFSYQSNSIFKNFNHEFSQGINLIKGKNGSGKSTLLAILGRQIQNFKGSINFNENQEYRFIYLPDSPVFYPNFTGREFLLLSSKLRKFDLEKCLKEGEELFSIFSFLDSPLRSLSLGQKKKIFLCASLVKSFPIWIFDEPLNGLDVKSLKNFVERIYNHGKIGGIVILSGHQDEEIQKYNPDLTYLS